MTIIIKIALFVFLLTTMYTARAEYYLSCETSECMPVSSCCADDCDYDDGCGGYQAYCDFPPVVAIHSSAYHRHQRYDSNEMSDYTWIDP